MLGILLFTLIGGMLFLSFGFLISSFAKSYDEATPITTVANLLFLVTGNVFFPVSVFPEWIQQIAKRLPLTYLANGLRINFGPQGSLRNSFGNLYPLVIWLVIVFGFTIYYFKTGEE